MIRQVPAHWAAAPDEGSLERLTAALGDQAHAGVVLVGPVGAGKTQLADTAAELFAADHTSARVARVVGTVSARIVPFGALAHLVDVGDAGKTTDLLRAARASLRDSGELLVIVDDAHHLDKLSATLVYQLAVTRAASLIVTVDPQQPVPEAISALWTDDVLTRIDLTQRDGDPQVVDYLAALPGQARGVLQYLAVADPLPLGDLVALTGQESVAVAAAAGAVRVERAHDGRIVHSGHPLYTDTVRAALAPADLRRLRSAVVDRLSARPAGDVIARLRLAALALDSDTARPVGEVVGAAQAALRLGDMDLGERLARAALDRSGGLPARLALATALAWQGRGREADEVLAPVDPAQLSETDVMAWALPRAANQFWMLGEPTRAAAFLQATRNRVVAPNARATLDALAATFAMNAGTPHRALRIADEVLASPSADQQAVGWAASTAALSCARIGRFHDVDALAARAVAAEHPGLLRFTGGFGRTTALLMTGGLDEARSLAQRYTDFAELQQPGRAIGEVLVAHVAIAQGDFDAAVTLLRRAADALAPTGYSWGPLSLMLLAMALGQQGDRIDAAKVLSNAESRHGLKSALFTPELSLARAWTRAARHDSQGAIDAAREAVQAAERGGQSAVAVRALHDAVRLGDTGAVYRLQRLAGEVDCVLARLALAHARALVDDDRQALLDVATELDAVGLRRAAADAAAQAERLG
jgi:ABC-type polar amino acid transport system ATPase subunit